MAHLNVSIPHFYCFIRREYLYDLRAHAGEHERVCVFGVASIPSRAIMFHCVTDGGAQFARLPISAFCWKTEAPAQKLSELELWDCFSYEVTATVFEYLKEMRARALLGGKWHMGRYMFTVDWSHGPLAEDPGEGGHKNAHVLMLDNGNFCAQPNNRILWHEASFMTRELKERPDYKTNSHVWSAEGERDFVTEDSDRYFYETWPLEAAEHGK